MPDWKQVVREHLTSRQLSADIRKDIVNELSSHLEETYEAGLERGLGESEAMNHALSEVRWRKLARAIDRAKHKEEPMNPRMRALWAAIVVAMAAVAALIFLNRSGLNRLGINLLSRVGHYVLSIDAPWLAALPVPLAVGILLARRYTNQRTQRFWFPAFVSLTTASLFLFAAETVLMRDPSLFLTRIGLQPQSLIRLNWDVTGSFYMGWLLAHVLFGALGAFLSRRAGGVIAERVVAGAFPAIVMFFLCGVVIPISARLEHNPYLFQHLPLFVLGVLIWAGMPGLALLVGVAPFLKESSHGRLAARSA